MFLREWPALEPSGMARVLVGLACLLALGGCASWLPSLEFGGGSTVELRADSEPPGAEARTSMGQACRTPCAMPVPASSNFTVTFTLPGFVPQSVPVQVRMPTDPRMDPNATASVQLIPNPVEVALEPAPAPKPVRWKPSPQRRVAPKPAVPAAAQPAPAAR